MSNLKYYIVDVFAQERFTGNQVAVVVVESPLDEEIMLKIAQEMNFRETSFISSEPNTEGHYDVRIFTPKKEVAFSGHPTLGTAFVVNHFLSFGAKKQISLQLKSGVTFVEYMELKKNGSNFISKQKTILLSDQKEPEFGHIFEPVLLSRVLGLEPAEIDNRFPIQEVFSGLGFIIVPIKTLQSVKNIQINVERYNWLVQKAKAKVILAFCSDTEHSEHDIHSRVFANYYNIPEDAASGSGSGCLGAYLIRNDYFQKNSIELHIEQGYEIGRPSLIVVRAELQNDQIQVNIGGRVILTAQGEIII
ncbi:MAG: PhzF family phenazine biosynthesis protein [Candidatus Lokiarchaeota archaeon]|nr:PhzF family phenazine biosynthesis protein [Candidatus Harpocratesius repetitus]